MSTLPNDSNVKSHLKLKSIALGIRHQALELALARGGGYLSQACSSAEMFAALFGKLLTLGPSAAPLDPDDFIQVPKPGSSNVTPGELYLGERGANYDRFYLSPSHYCVALYAVLCEIGRMNKGCLSKFNIDGSTLEMIGAEHSPGMGLTTGSFGQALSQVAGIALARRLRGENGRNWLFMSDGELNEGQFWEALAFCSIHKLREITVIVDVNGQQVDGTTAQVFDMGDLAGKLRAFGAHVLVVDGHDLNALADLNRTVSPSGPVFVLALTDTARGLPVLVPRKPNLHYVTVNAGPEREALEKCLEEMSFQKNQMGVE